MKRAILIGLCICLLMVLTGCGSNQNSSQQSSSSVVDHGVVAKTVILSKQQLAEFDAQGLADAGITEADLKEPVATDIPLFTTVPSAVVETVAPTATPELTPEPTPVVTEAPVINIIYRYEGVTDEAVLATLPDDTGKYHLGDEVEPSMPTSTSVETEEGTWTFDGWVRIQSDNGVNMTITGTWSFTVAPTPSPTPEPTPEPTIEPTPTPTLEPTLAPTSEPTVEITEVPVTPEVVSDSTPLPPLEIPTRPPQSALNPMTNTGYRFQNFVLEKAGISNAVFSGEAILSALDLWNSLTTGAEHDVITKYVGRDYLSYESSNSMLYIRKLWLDTLLTKGDRFPKSLEKITEMLNMKDTSATSRKNSWLAKETANYFMYTPSVLDDKTYVDITSLVYFRDVWKTGMKPYDTKERIFHNADGTTTNTTMLRDEGLTYWRLDNAVAYCMYFYNGHYLMVVLPDEGVDCKDVDVRSLMTGKIPSKKAHVRFFMPEFDTESAYTLYLNDFMLSGGFVDETVVMGLPADFAPVFTQVDKVSFTQYGCGNVTTEEKMADPPTSYSDDLDVLSIICDRPFMYYVGDTTYQDIALFGVLNYLPESAEADQ